MNAHNERTLPQAILVGGADGDLAIVHSLARQGVRVSVLITAKRDWLARSRMVDGYVLGSLPEDTEAWLATLERLAEDHGEGVLIAGSDRAVELLVAERDRIPASLRSFESPTSAHPAFMDKASLYELADSVGVRRPWTLRLRAPEELDEVRAKASYPCLIKPALSHLWRRRFGEHRVLQVRDATELAPLATPGLEAGLELLVSEYIPGPERGIEGACTVRTAEGEYTLSYGRRKLRQYPPGFGAGSVMESAPVPETERLAKRLLDAGGFVGLSMIEAKRHAETGEMVLIEANVRVPQSFGLGDASGTEASWRLYATLAGLPLGPEPAQVPGVRNVMLTLEPRAAWAHLAGGGSLRSLAESYRRVRDVSGFSIRDPEPTVIIFYEQLKFFGRYLARRRRGDR